MSKPQKGRKQIAQDIIAGIRAEARAERQIELSAQQQEQDPEAVLMVPASVLETALKGREDYKKAISRCDSLMAYPHVWQGQEIGITYYHHFDEIRVKPVDRIVEGEVLVRSVGCLPIVPEINQYPEINQ